MTSRHPKCNLCGRGSRDVKTLYPHEVDALFANSEIDVAQRAALEASRTSQATPKVHKTGPCHARINTALQMVRLVQDLAAAAAADVVVQEKIRVAKILAADSLGALYSLSVLSDLVAITAHDDLLCISLHNCLFLQVWRPLPTMATTTMTTPYPTPSLRHWVCPCRMPLRAPLLPRS